MSSGLGVGVGTGSVVGIGVGAGVAFGVGVGDGDGSGAAQDTKIMTVIAMTKRKTRNRFIIPPISTSYSQFVIVILA